MGATVYYLVRASKLMGKDNMGFNNALKGRISSQAATVGFIILGAWGLKRQSYLKQIEKEVITGMCGKYQGFLLLYPHMPSSIVTMSIGRGCFLCPFVVGP